MAAETIKTPDDISWYVERTKARDNVVKTPQNIVLIPSGEGDCHAFKWVCPLIAEAGHHVITFDLPGFSRTIAPLEAYDPITPQKVADQIITLLDTLNIKEPAVFWGSSSGGATVIAMSIYHSQRTKCAIIHEVPFNTPDGWVELRQKPDAEIIAYCTNMFNNVIAHDKEDQKRWTALGPDYHARLEKNYVTWMHHLVDSLEHETRKISTPENLRDKPLFWTIGSLNGDMGKIAWKDDYDIAARVGIEINDTVLDSMHFPSVTVPEQLRDWILQCMQKVEG